MGRSGPSPPLQQVAFLPLPVLASPASTKTNKIRSTRSSGFLLAPELSPAADRRDGPPSITSDWGKVRCSEPSPLLLVDLSAAQLREDRAHCAPVLLCCRCPSGTHYFEWPCGHESACGRRRASCPEAIPRQDPRRATRAKPGAMAASPNVDWPTWAGSRSCLSSRQATRPRLGVSVGAAQRPLSLSSACSPAAVATAAPGVMKHRPPFCLRLRLKKRCRQCGTRVFVACRRAAPVLGFGCAEPRAGHG